MRICMIGDARSIHTQTISGWLARNGHQVLVLSPEYGFVPGASVEVIGNTGTNPKFVSRLHAHWKILALIRHSRCDVINVQYYSGAALSTLLVPHVPLVISFWGSDLLSANTALSPQARWLLPRILHHAAFVTSVADHMTERLLRLGVPEQRIMTGQYGLSAGSFDPPQDPVRAPVIVSTRNMSDPYRIPELVEAIPDVLARVPGARFILAGSGPHESSLKARVRELGVDNSVEFAGYIPHDQIRALLAQGRVFVSLSASDGAPLSLLEAMASGLLPVVSDIAANSEWVVDGVNGIVTAVERAPLADALVRALTDDEVRNRAYESNPAIVRERADLDQYMKRFVDRLAAVVGNRNIK